MQEVSKKVPLPFSIFKHVSCDAWSRLEEGVTISATKIRALTMKIYLLVESQRRGQERDYPTLVEDDENRTREVQSLQAWNP